MRVQGLHNVMFNTPSSIIINIVRELAFDIISQVYALYKLECGGDSKWNYIFLSGRPFPSLKEISLNSPMLCAAMAVSYEVDDAIEEVWIVPGSSLIRGGSGGVLDDACASDIVMILWPLVAC